MLLVPSRRVLLLEDEDAFSFPLPVTHATHLPHSLSMPTATAIWQSCSKPHLPTQGLCTTTPADGVAVHIPCVGKGASPSCNPIQRCPSRRSLHPAVCSVLSATLAESAASFCYILGRRGLVVACERSRVRSPAMLNYALTTLCS